MDPDEFLRCLLPYSPSLADKCTIQIEETLTCDACPEVTNTISTHTGWHLFIKGNTIENMIANNMESSFKAKCKNTNVDATRSKKESFIFLPDIFFIVAKKVYKPRKCL